MKSTFGKLLIAAVIAVTAAVVIPVTAKAATEKKGDYTVSDDGQETSIMAYHGTAFLNFESVKTYANGTVRKDKFKYYLQSPTSFYDIPGIYNANVLGTNCKTMVPQGICMMDGLTLISAYDSGEKGKAKCNSVIYILNSDGLLATLVLPNKIHAGGLIYDGTNVWITNGSTNYAKSEEIAEADKHVYYYSKKQITGAVYYCQAGGYLSARIDIQSQKKSIDVDAAYCTYYDGRLWFGNFSSTGTSMIYAYNVSYNSSNVPSLSKAGDMEAPRATQGIAFYRYGGKTYLIVSTSYGRNKEATDKFTNKLIVYKPTDYDKWNNAGAVMGDYHKGARLKDITIPYMSENVYANNTLMYIIFESGAYKYDGREEDAQKGNDDKADNLGRVPKEIVCDKYCALDFYKVAIE